MQPPDELMTQAFLPAMRQLVASKLRSEGLSQNKISSLLGTTQASVSIYLSSDRQRTYDALAALHIGKDDADRYASELSVAVARGPAEGVRALAEIWTALLGAGSVCEAHRDLHPSLAGCDFCVVEYGPGRGEKQRVVAEVADAVRVLEASPEFAAVMPEVSVNIACAVGEPSSPADVVAVPGRIVKLRGRARAMLPPEAGASVHMARVLLLARSRVPELRACVNLRYDARMAAAMRRAHLRTMSISGTPRPGSEDPTVAALERKLKSPGAPFDAVIDEGGGGIEPNVYLFAKSAGEVAGLAIRLANSYSAG